MLYICAVASNIYCHTNYKYTLPHKISNTNQPNNHIILFFAYLNVCVVFLSKLLLACPGKLTAFIQTNKHYQDLILDLALCVLKILVM